MSIAFANDSEAREISRMAIKIWHECYKGIITKGQIEYMLMSSQTERKILEQMDSGYQYGFIFDGSSKAGYFAILPEKDSLFLSKLYLDKSFRGKGLGSNTLNEITSIGRSMGKKRTYVHVNRNNLTAIKAYERSGFVRGCERKADIGDGYFTDDYVYEYIYRG